MRNLLLFIFSILLLSACDQENINDNIAENLCGLELENVENYDCAIGHYADIEEIESVISEEEEIRYLEIWKNIFFKKTGMTEAYFEAHFLNLRTYASEWNTGITLNVVYDYKLDWLEFSHSDKLLIYMKSSVAAYQHYNIPRDTLLDESGLVHRTVSKF